MSYNLTLERDDSYSATYCPEDNKLRLYLNGDRVSREAYLELKNKGFRSTPKQECDFVAPWSCKAEDACYDLLPEYDDIGDEDYSPAERAADRAERFENYRDNRRGDASDYGDSYESGDSAYGNQNARRAQRQADRRDRYKRHALSNWSKAEYWQRRTEGVISHALHKAKPGVRRGRILVLEAEQRRHLAAMQEQADRFNAWKGVLSAKGCESPIELTDHGIAKDSPPAAVMAYMIANTNCMWGGKHPDSPHGENHTTYDLLRGAYCSEDRTYLRKLSPKEVAEIYIDGREQAHDEESGAARWARHYERRLAYEMFMISNEGGLAGEVEMEIGGFMGKHQIYGINKSPKTGRVVSVKLMAPEEWYRGPGPAPLKIRSFNIERLGEGSYRAPTEEEKAEFLQRIKEEKEAAKKGKPKAPSLLNPTEEDAQRLQDLLNAVGYKKHQAKTRFSDYKPTEILLMKQEAYSAHSKGSYSMFETRTLHDCGRLSLRYSNMYDSERSKYEKSLGDVVAKIRVREGGDFFNPPRIVVITDKPQKPLPLDWSLLEAAAQEQTCTESQ